MIIGIAFISGLILGVIFFGGLWLTVRKALGTNYASLWFLGSSLLRMAIVLVGFYFVSKSGLLPLLMSVAGFVAARFLVMWQTKILEQKEIVSIESKKL